MAPPEVQTGWSKVESEWYKALFEEDCVEVMRLLKVDPRLLTVGWKSGPREVQGRPGNFWKEEKKSKWKGRTALHVAARRGCAKLVEEVIGICRGKYRNPKKPPPPARHHEEDNSSFTKNKQPTIVSPNQSHVVQIEGVNRSDTKNSAGSSDCHDDALVAPEGDRLGDGTRKNIVHSSPSQDDADLAVGGDSHAAEEPAQTAKTSSADEGPGTSSAEILKDKKTELIRALMVALSKNVEGVAEIITYENAVNLVKSKFDKEDRNADDKPDSPGCWVGAEFSVCIKDLLPLKDGEYKLEAIAIALLNGNLDVLFLLSKIVNSPDVSWGNLAWKGKNPILDRLRTTTEGLVEKIMVDPATSTKFGSIFGAYSKHRDFNFLPQGEYLFHFLFSSCFSSSSMHDDDSVIEAEVLRELVWSVVVGESSSQEDALWKFLLKLQDGQGRTPLHVAVDERTVRYFVNLFGKGDDRGDYIGCAVSASDASGRTSSHRAAALGALDELEALGDLSALNDGPFRRDELWYRLLKSESVSGLETENVLSFMEAKEIYNPGHDTSFDGKDYSIDAISERSGFQGRRLMQRKFFMDNPLHSAIAHKIIQIVYKWNRGCEYRLNRPFVSIRGFYSGHDADVPCYLSTLELATLVGNLSMVKALLDHGETTISRTAELWGNEFEGVPELSGKANLLSVGILLAARHGNYEMLKITMDHPSYACDPFVEDPDGNTALHYAMKMGPIEIFNVHLLDFVNCEHIQAADPRNTDNRVSENSENSIIDRQGCINLLLQKGCDIFKPNRGGEIPYPSGDLGTNAKFLSWWYDKQAKEFGAIQNTMSIAANAISVTAALVATTSYAGPLQPPLGYGGDDQMQVKNIWVRAFIVCDTLSFYLAIASITFSLIPSLPMPQQPMMKELRQKRTMVALATAILFPSIICILVAFASSSIGGTIANGPSSVGGRLTIISTSIGGLVCFIGFTVFLIRLLKLALPTAILEVLRSIYRGVLRVVRRTYIRVLNAYKFNVVRRIYRRVSIEIRRFRRSPIFWCKYRLRSRC